MEQVLRRQRIVILLLVTILWQSRNMKDSPLRENKALGQQVDHQSDQQVIKPETGPPMQLPMPVKYEGPTVFVGKEGK